MKIELEQSGGFAGLLRRTTLETTDLPPDEAAELRELASRALRSAPLPSPSQARDLTFYEITVEKDDGSRHTLRFDDLSLPPEAAPLLRRLQEKSTPG